jgi:hypothetical protein
MALHSTINALSLKNVRLCCPAIKDIANPKTRGYQVEYCLANGERR